MEGLQEIEASSKSGPFFDTFLALPSDASNSEFEKTVYLVKDFFNKRFN
jgi:hypothetical protein